MLRAFGQKHGSLTCSVPAADDNDFFAAAKLRLNERSAVIHACSFKARQVLQR